MRLLKGRKNKNRWVLESECQVLPKIYRLLQI